jgi:hypothetical protein
VAAATLDSYSRVPGGLELNRVPGVQGPRGTGAKHGSARGSAKCCDRWFGYYTGRQERQAAR